MWCSLNDRYRIMHTMSSIHLISPAFYISPLWNLHRWEWKHRTVGPKCLFKAQKQKQVLAKSLWQESSAVQISNQRACSFGIDPSHLWCLHQTHQIKDTEVPFTSTHCGCVRLAGRFFPWLLFSCDVWFTLKVIHLCSKTKICPDIYKMMCNNNNMDFNALGGNAESCMFTSSLSFIYYIIIAPYLQTQCLPFTFLLANECLFNPGATKRPLTRSKSHFTARIW